MHGIMHPARAAHHLLAVLALCGLVVALLPGAAEAAKWDPRYRWNTLFTENFAIHFHQGETELAVELAQSAEEIHDLLSESASNSRQPPKKLELKEDKDKGVFVKDLTQTITKSIPEIEKAMNYGTANRKTATTAMNAAVRMYWIPMTLWS